LEGFPAKAIYLEITNYKKKRCFTIRGISMFSKTINPGLFM
jgi:hypothetical protein